MSTKIFEGEGLIITCFWGGDDLRGCYQITVEKENVLTRNDGNHIRLTLAQIHALHRALKGFLASY